MVVSSKQIKGMTKTVTKWIMWSLITRIITKFIWTFIIEWSSAKSEGLRWQDQNYKCADINTKNTFQDACLDAEIKTRVWPIVHALWKTYSNFPMCIEYNCEDIWSALIAKFSIFGAGIPLILLIGAIIWFSISSVHEKWQWYQVNKLYSKIKTQSEISKDQDKTKYLCQYPSSPFINVEDILLGQRTKETVASRNVSTYPYNY